MYVVRLSEPGVAVMSNFGLIAADEVGARVELVLLARMEHLIRHRRRAASRVQQCPYAGIWIGPNSLSRSRADEKPHRLVAAADVRAVQAAAAEVNERLARDRSRLL